MTREEILSRHRKEVKELQGKIQSIKKSVSKGDKKAKKRTTEEIALLQSELDNRHAAELLESERGEGLESGVSEGLESGVSEGLEQLSVSVALSEVKSEVKSEGKVSKAQKRREAKDAAESLAMAEIDNIELETGNSAKSQEHLTIATLCRSKGYKVYDIPADGNCMFYALQHQIEGLGRSSLVSGLREEVSEYMRLNKDDFQPYLVHHGTGDVLNDQQFYDYCEDIKRNGVWGGMHEAQAVSAVLLLPIDIIQADSPPIRFGEHYKGSEPLILLYYKHKFGLGEHYDSVVKIKGDEKEGEDEEG